MPLAFFDGTLLVSFSLPQTELQERFIEAMLELVQISRETKVPLVGYIDRSFSRDLLNLLDAFEIGKRLPKNRRFMMQRFCTRETSKIKQVLKNWGDRTMFLLFKAQRFECIY